MLHVPLRLALLVLSCALAAAGRRRDVESKSFGMPGQYCTVVVEGLPSRDLLQVIDESRVRGAPLALAIVALLVTVCLAS